MANTEVNLGLVQAVKISTTPPTNTAQIWFDNNVGQKVHKVYATVSGTWVLLAPNAGQGFGVYTVAITNSISINVLQSTHQIVEISNIQILKYLPLPDDYFEFVDLLSEGIEYKVAPNFDVEIDNPNQVLLQVKISGRK